MVILTKIQVLLRTWLRKKPEYIRQYLPADANSLLAVMDKTLRSEEKSELNCGFKTTSSTILQY